MISRWLANDSRHFEWASMMIHDDPWCTQPSYVPSNPGKLGQEVDELRIALQGERAALSVLRSQQLNEADGETDAMNSSTEPESSLRSS